MTRELPGRKRAPRLHDHARHGSLVRLTSVDLTEELFYKLERLRGAGIPRNHAIRKAVSAYLKRPEVVGMLDAADVDADDHA